MRARWVLGAELVAGACLVILAMWPSGGMPAVATRETPTSGGYVVKLEVQGGPTAFFTEISGLGPNPKSSNKNSNKNSPAPAVR